jgi:hypothetical protein
MSAISEKFLKEYHRFIDWFPLTEYKLFDKNGNELRLKDVSIEGYEEPCRNKLETYIKYVMKNHLLSKDGEEITDIKLLAKQFREYKPKRSRSKSSSDDLDKNVKNKKQKIQKDEKQKNQKDEKKEDVKPVKPENSEKFVVIVRNANSYTSFGSSNRSLCSLTKEDFNTSDTFYIDTLPYWTKQLRRCFGNPTEYDNEDFKYEWKIMVGSKIFSIYNWLNDENKFDDLEECEWYLAANSINTSEQKFLMEFINNINSHIDENESYKQDEDEEDEDEEELEENVEDEDKEDKEDKEEESCLEENVEDEDKEDEELEENVEIDDRESMIDIELDLIDDDDLEINIDDIEF